jgi:type IV secretion system protein VirB11
MLTFLKEPVTYEKEHSPQDWLRNFWRNSLDQGHIPTHKDLAEKFNQLFSDKINDLNEWYHTMTSQWLFKQASNTTTEIFAHGEDFIEIHDINSSITHFPGENQDWSLWIETLATMMKTEFHFQQPCISSYFFCGRFSWRITFLHASLQSNSTPKVFMRKISNHILDLEHFSFDLSAQNILINLMHNRKNILIAGATGSGKTTFLSSLLKHRSPEEHTIILEDTEEIRDYHPRVTRLISQNHPGRSLTDYMSYALRFSPQRIILGEMRSKEVVPFLLAMNTGHEGLLSTIHASSASDALLRLAQLFTLTSGHSQLNYQEVLRLVTRNIQYVIFLKDKKIKQIIKVFGSDADLPIYEIVWEDDSSYPESKDFHEAI